ncbi:MAG: response regulator [Sandaracinaceae bacterium]|nr:response regulator [Sandaracinaceae bacterium]
MTTPRIVAVDDDRAMLASIVQALEPVGSVQAFDDPRTAVEELDGSPPPDLVVSDIVMPEIGGFELRRRLSTIWRGQHVPFVFLSSLADPETMVAGLESGADDYVTKPFSPELLRARARALLRRVERLTPAFRGELASVGFAELLRFCEVRRFTGEIVIESPTLTTKVAVHGGELDDGAADVLDALLALEAGTFELRAGTVDFAELGTSPIAQSWPSGRVSSVMVEGKLVRIETEALAGTPPILVSVATRQGQPVAKQKRFAPEAADAARLQTMLDALHEEACAAIQDRIAAARVRRQDGTPLEHAVAAASSASQALAPVVASEPPKVVHVPHPPPTPSPEEAANEAGLLFDEGLDHARNGAWAKALSLWEQALELQPDNRMLIANLEIARRKTQAG